MKHLFGTRSHPFTGEPFWTAYKVYGNTGVDGFNAEVARRMRTTSATRGVARPQYDVLARERFVADHAERA
jgi:hypothetical protein